MKTTNKKTLEEIIRVDHAGERGAIKIYEGQLLALNTFKKNEKLKKSITKFRQDDIEHKNLAYNEGATKKGLYFVLDKIIQTTSKAAIKVSEKI